MVLSQNLNLKFQISDFKSQITLCLNNKATVKTAAGYTLKGTLI